MKRILSARTKLAKEKSKKLLAIKDTDQDQIQGMATAILGTSVIQDLMLAVADF